MRVLTGLFLAAMLSLGAASAAWSLPTCKDPRHQYESTYKGKPLCICAANAGGCEARPSEKNCLVTIAKPGLGLPQIYGSGTPAGKVCVYTLGREDHPAAGDSHYWATQIKAPAGATKICEVKVNGKVIKTVQAKSREDCYKQTSFGSENCKVYASYFSAGSNLLEQYFNKTDRVNNEKCKLVCTATQEK